MPATSPARSTRTTAPATRRKAAAALLGLGALLLACPDGGGPPPLGADGGGTIHRDGGGGGETWTSSLVDEGGMGMGIRTAASAGGAVGAAWWSTAGRIDGTCDELGGDQIPDRVRWTLRYGAFDGDGWTVEDVAEPLLVGAPRGLALAFAPDGTPTLVAHTGGPVAQIRYCGASDVGVYRRAGGAWSVETAVATSGEAASGLPASDYGDVVGDWPALAFTSAGDAVIAYKDVHAGGMQSDDFRRADLEVAWQEGSGWRHLPVDMGEGAGSYNALAFDGEGRPVIVFHVATDGLNASRHGVWAARSEDGGATWHEVQLHAGSSAEGPSVVYDSVTDQLLVAWYDASEGFARVGRLVDPASFDDVGAGWSLERVGDPRYDEGYRPSLAVAPDGRVAMAYHRCVKATSGLGSCDPNDDAVVFAWEDGGEWTYEVADAGGAGTCGLYPSLSFDASGRAVVVYQCAAETADGFDLRVYSAVREPLP